MFDRAENTFLQLHSRSRQRNANRIYFVTIVWIFFPKSPKSALTNGVVSATLNFSHNFTVLLMETLLPVEICCERLDSVQNAVIGGASRIELCAALLEGGLTPSVGTIR